MCSQVLVKRFFPQELRSTIDPDYNEKDTRDTSEKDNLKGKSLQIPGYEQLGHLNTLDNELDDDEAPEGPTKDPEDEGGQEDDLDEEFDEEDEGGDYNAEMYFDDGGDDVGEDHDGG